MPYLHKYCKTDHYNSNKAVKIKLKNGYIPNIYNKNWIYDGYWVNNNRQGFGILAKRTQCLNFIPKYKGEWYVDKRHGPGNGYYIDGGYYVGQWKNGKRSGYGKMWYSDSSFYAGDWKCDKRNGLGLFVNVNGDRYEGHWFNDKKHGQGRLYHLLTGQMQEGIWHQDDTFCSTFEDIPFRQTAVYPTEYPIQKVELQELEGIINNFQMFTDSIVENRISQTNND